MIPCDELVILTKCAVRLGLTTRRGVAIDIAHDLPEAKLREIGGISARLRTQCEIATPERKTITQRALLLQVRVHALAALPIRI